MVDQLLSLDNLAAKSTITASTALYTDEERSRLNELVNMDVDLETAAEMYFEIATFFDWPMDTNEAGENIVSPGLESPDDTYEYLETGVTHGVLVPTEIRAGLPEDRHAEWDKKFLEIQNENYEETKKIQDAANRRRTDPEVQKFERFMSGLNEYGLQYWEENQNKKLAATGPKSPLVLGVNFDITRNTTEATKPTVAIQAVASFRKKSIFSAS